MNSAMRQGRAKRALERAARESWMSAYAMALVSWGAAPGTVDWDRADYYFRDGMTPEHAARYHFGCVIDTSHFL